MSKRNINRRDFLRLGGLTVAGGIVAACTPAAAPTVAPAATEAAAAPTSPPAAKEVVLDFIHDTPEYQNQFQQILDIFMEENPGVKINNISHSEDAQAAYAAKVAGGYYPAMEVPYATSNTFRINAENYQNFVDLSTIGFPYWDKWVLFDAKNAWSKMYGLPGPRCLNSLAGYVITWVWHEDLMQKIGLNPRDEVKTWDDLLAWLQAGADWVAKDGAKEGVAVFWDQGWLPDWFGGNYLKDHMTLAFPDGQRKQQHACWFGDAKFNAENSPYRHTFEFFKQAYDGGWISKNFWTRNWDQDMEASFIAKKAVVQLHGTWIWDKAVAANPGVQLMGMPSTPPAEGQSEWKEFIFDPDIDTGEAYFMRIQNEKDPNWEMIKKLFAWWSSPATTKLRAEATGFLPAIKLDEPANMVNPQWVGVVKDIDTPGGKWEKTTYEGTLSGELQLAPRRIPGSPGVWDYESGNNAQYWADLMEGKTTVKAILDQAQKNWEASYKID